MNKKGSFQDLMYLVYFALFMAIGIVISQWIFSGINDSGMFTQDFDVDNRSQQLADQFESNVFPAMDSMFLITFVAGFIIAGFMAFRLRSHPAFYWVYSIFLGVSVWLAAVMANIYTRFMEDSSEVIADMGLSTHTVMTTHIMENLVMYTLVLGVILMFILYSVNKQESFGAI